MKVFNNKEINCSQQKQINSNSTNFIKRSVPPYKKGTLKIKFIIPEYLLDTKEVQGYLQDSSQTCFTYPGPMSSSPSIISNTLRNCLEWQKSEAGKDCVYSFSKKSGKKTFCLEKSPLQTFR